VEQGVGWFRRPHYFPSPKEDPISPVKDRALVLGGGGVAGIAWMTGLLTGLDDRGIDLRSAEMILGTSAGSTLGAQLGSLQPLGELFRKMTDPSAQTREISPSPRRLASFREAVSGFAAVPDRAERIRQIGKWALEVPPDAQAERRQIVAGRLPSHRWPEQDLRIVAVEAESGETTVFDRDSSADLVDAVAASCALPGIWPAVPIGGRHYIDGGVRSSENADLAAGYRRVLILSPMGLSLPRIAGNVLGEQIERLEQAGSKTLCIHPDSASRKAIGLNPLLPETRQPAAEAGREQGRAIGQEIAGFWGVLPSISKVVD
jgi:NTE family protein